MQIRMSEREELRRSLVTIARLVVLGATVVGCSVLGDDVDSEDEDSSSDALAGEVTIFE